MFQCNFYTCVSCYHFSINSLWKNIIIYGGILQPSIVRWLCNIFELIFTPCHKCNKYNCLPWKMLNHTGNSYITRRKQLCHPPDTVMSHRIQLYHPLVKMFSLLIGSGSRCNYAIAKQSKQRKGMRAVYSILFDFVFT